ncbi:MAG: sugar ABC transporter permease [Clostridiales bacterium]|nr:sugar ABC transporter permease [Clostridiales bacterium]
MEKSLKKYFPVFTVPTLLAFLLAFIIPFFMGLWLSLCKFNTVTNAKFTGFSNFIKVFKDAGFRTSFLFTLKFAIVAVITINVFAFLLSLLLTRKLKGTNIFRTIFFMPNLIGGIVLGYIWNLIINGILMHWEVTMTYDPKYGFWGLIVLMNWQMIGYMMIVYVAGIQNLPTDVMEAAKIDGANKIQTLFRVTIPLMMPQFTICLFLTISNSFKLFDQNLALTAGDPSRKTEMLALNIYNTYYGTIGYEGVGQAKAVIFFILVAVVAITQLAATRQKEVES